jgi:hypothetical protein
VALAAEWMRVCGIVIFKEPEPRNEIQILACLRSSLMKTPTTSPARVLACSSRTAALKKHHYR